MKDLFRAIRIVTKHKWLTVANFIVQMIVTVLGLLPALLYKQIFDILENTIKSPNNVSQYSEPFFFYSFLYLLLAISTLISNRFSMYLWVKWANETERTLNEDSFQHLQTLSMDYFTTNSTGKLIEIVSKGIGETQRVVETVLFNYFPQFVTFLVTTVILFKTSWIFGLIIGLGIPLYIVISLAFSKRIIKIHDDIRSNYEKISAVRTESIINIKTIKSYARENYQQTRFSKNMTDKVRNNLLWAKVANIMHALRGVLYQSSIYLSLVLGIYLVINHKLTLGGFVLVWTYVNKAYDPMWWTMRMYDELVKQMRTVKKFYEFLDTKPTVVDKEGALPLKVKEGIIELKNLRFSYPDNDKRVVLRGINLIIPGKSTVAIVGKSGSGKTTLAKLLLRFHDISGGSIKIDNQDISNVTQKSLREKISYVLQDSMLFNDTAKNNIRFGKLNATTKQVINAAKLANADEFIQNLPKKYNTVVGERGVKLSGGEQQRINIARAILKGAPILILDEATSSLDSESELVIQEALDNLIKDKTTIIIAHRLATIMRADMIVVMDKGKIVEIGTHRDLIDKKGIYSRLFDIQSGAFLLEDEIIDSKLEEKVAVNV